jgi:hypothetical protein
MPVFLRRCRTGTMAGSHLVQETYSGNAIVNPGLGCDNQGALKLLETGVVQAKTKHIDVKYHHTRDEVQKKTDLI